MTPQVWAASIGSVTFWLLLIIVMFKWDAITYKLGRRWIITLWDGVIDSRRYWSREKAQAEAESRNMARIHFGQEPAWTVEDVKTRLARGPRGG